MLILKSLVPREATRVSAGAKLRHCLVVAALISTLAAGTAGARGRWQQPWQAQVFPSEQRIVRDEQTGAQVIFVTTDAAPDYNLYFHQRSFLADGSMLLFTSGRKEGGLMGYLFQTGELVRLTGPHGGLSGVTAARHRNSVLGLRGKQVVELAVKVEPSAEPGKRPSRVTCVERVIANIPEGMGPSTDLSENADGSLLACGVRFKTGESGIILIGVKTGKVSQVCRADHVGHVQFSHGSAHLLSFAGTKDRLMVVDVRERKPRSIHKQAPGELVTHECWWVDDYMTFCGGYRDGESHVKVISPFSGEIRIIGAGAWWPGGTPSEYARWNWWHAAGSPDGRWVAADNWHGVIAIFDGKTTRMRILTQVHRVYGRGEHPHVGWADKGSRVVFTSNRFGNPDVCVALIPADW